MAKGNDGNFLQHSVEVAAAKQLAAKNPNALHIAITHGMAPFECLEIKLNDKEPGLVRRRLKTALRLASQDPQEGESSIVTAYRDTKASCVRYPNTAELLRSIRGGKDGSGLSGGITEIRPIKCEKLAKAWAGSSVKVACESWRSQVCRGGVLACPDDLKVPWLFTMDPMTYRHKEVRNGHNSEEDKLCASDFDPLFNALAPFVKSKQPGIATLFVYNVWEKNQGYFRCFAKELAECLDIEYHFHSITHRGANKNLAALLHSSINIPSDFIQNAVECIPDETIRRVLAEIQASWPPMRSKAMTPEEREDLLEEILCILNTRRERATYSVVACILEISPRGVGGLLGRHRPWASWVVSKGGGEPTGYAKCEKHPDLYNKPEWMKSCCKLRECLKRPLPEHGKHVHGCDGGC